MAGAAINGGKLDRDFGDFLDVLDAEAIGVQLTLADYRAMTEGERAAWRAWQKARRERLRLDAGKRGATRQASIEGRAAWLAARAQVEQG